MVSNVAKTTYQPRSQGFSHAFAGFPDSEICGGLSFGTFDIASSRDTFSVAIHALAHEGECDSRLSAESVGGARLEIGQAASALHQRSQRAFRALNLIEPRSANNIRTLSAPQPRPTHGVANGLLDVQKILNRQTAIFGRNY